MGHGGCFWEGPTWAHGCPCTLRPLHRSRSPAGFAVGPFAGDGDAPGLGWHGGGGPQPWGWGGDKGAGGIVQGPVLGTQQMALPPRAAELGTQLLPTVTSPGGPGHAQGCLSPSLTRGVTPCPIYSFFGRGREVEGGQQPPPTSSSPGQGHRNAAGQKQLSSSVPLRLYLHLQDFGFWFFFFLFSVGIFHMKSDRETFLAHAPPRTPGPASSRGWRRDGEMERCTGEGERERDGNSRGNRERVGNCLG